VRWNCAPRRPQPDGLERCQIISVLSLRALGNRSICRPMSSRIAGSTCLAAPAIATCRGEVIACWSPTNSLNIFVVLVQVLFSPPVPIAIRPESRRKFADEL